MGITKETRDKIKELVKAGYDCKQISEMMRIPESIVRHISSH